MSESTQNQQETQGQGVVVVQQGGSPVAGILSIVLGICSFFLFSLLFSPLAILFGVIALSKKQKATGIVGIIIAVAALLMSPSFLLLLGGMSM